MAKEPNFHLNKNISDEILNNILDTCNLPPSSDTLEMDIFMNNLKRRTYSALKIIAAVCLILVVLSPLLFRFNSQFKVLNSSRTVAVSSHTLYDNCFVMVLSGAADYSGIRAVKKDGALIFPYQTDPSSGVVILPYNGDALNIYIPTKSGECIQAVLNEKKQ